MSAAARQACSKPLSLLLRDGRRLAWREYGAGKGGTPIVFLHGNLNSRNFAPCWADTAATTAAAGARVLALDRPGYGASCAHPGRTYLDFAHDVDELAAHLELGRYAVCGYSSGGPHAIACAAANLGGRVAAAGLVSSDAPYVEMEGGIRKHMFGVEEDFEVDEAWAAQRAQASAERMRRSYEGMGNSTRREIALLDIATATAQGVAGSASDTVLEARAWDFDLVTGAAVRPSGTDSTTAATAGGAQQRQQQPAYFIWHGEDDPDVPAAAGRYLQLALGVPDGRARFIDGENHTLIRRHWAAILHDLVRAVGGTADSAASSKGVGGDGGPSLPARVGPVV